MIGQSAMMAAPISPPQIMRMNRPPCPPAISPTLRQTMSRDVGVTRDGVGLSRALDRISVLERAVPGALPLITARLTVQAALDRRESRGGHFRSDYPQALPVARHTVLRRAIDHEPSSAKPRETTP